MKPLDDFIAGKLLKVKAVKLQPQNPFVWATGWHSPIYCDNRKLLSYPQIRNVITLEMARVVAEKYPETEVIAGVATNAIAIGVLVAEALGLPFIYVHPTPKDHGFENMIEGDLRPRQNVVVIEDQVSVGNNSMKVVEAIRKDGCKVPGIVSIFDYELQDTIKKFKKANIELTSLSNFNAILRHSSVTEKFTDNDIQILQAWHKDPATWQK